MTQDYTSTNGQTTVGAIRRGFDNHEIGESYDRDLQADDWDYRDGGSNTAEIAEITDEESVAGGQSLKVTYSSEERLKTASKWELPPEDEYYLSYWVKFDEDFSFNGVEKSGGKLPGLGADEVPTGGDDVPGDTGFSARYMWRYDGQAELYLYHVDKADTFGDSVKFRYDDGEFAFFETGKWHNIVQRVKTNTDAEYDGEIDVWLDGEQVVDIDGVRLATNNQPVDVLYLSTFYGGGSADWLPPEDTVSYFDEIVVSTDAADVGIDPADIRSPDENPDQRPVGDGVVKGIQEFQPETTEQTLPDGNASILHDKQWGDGYTATLFYTPNADVSNWSVQVRTPGPIEDIWNAEIVSYEGGVYTLRGTTKPELDAGETANIRIKGEGHGSLVEFVDGQTIASRPAPAKPDPADPVPIGMDVAEPDVVDPVESDMWSDGDNSVSVDSQWNSGFIATINYTPGAATSGWSTKVRFAGEIENIWNGKIVNREGDVYTIEGVAYNSDLDAGETARIKIKGVGDGSEVTLLKEASAVSAEESDASSEAADQMDMQSDVGQNVGDSPFGAGDYSTVLNKSMQFYYAQYAGELAEDHPLSWRGDSVLDDGADVGRDLSGGWFDAGDHVKFGLPMAFSATMLAWGGDEFEEGYRATGAYDDLDAHLRHVTDYFLQAYDDKGTATVADDVFHAQVGNAEADHKYWGPPEDLDMDRPVSSVDANNPGTEVTGETAAALAASSIFFREQGDTDYADQLLAKAEKLFEFSETYQGTYNNSVPGAVPFYESYDGDFKDELAWSAAWLYKATGETSYLDKAEEFWEYPWEVGAISWDNKRNGVTQILAEETGKDLYKDALDQHIDHWLNDIERLEGTDTNDGLAWFTQWGTNRHAGSFSMLASVHAKHLAEEGGNDARVNEIMSLVTDQLDFMMGDNPDEFSFVVGFGDNFPQNPHHRGASGTTQGDPNPNVHVLDGALVGGPSDASGTYNDIRTDYITNEVATDYNAGFSGALAGVYEILTDDWGLA